MNTREELKAHVITCMLDGKMTVKEGAERLRLSERQVKQLKERKRKRRNICIAQKLRTAAKAYFNP